MAAEFVLATTSGTYPGFVCYVCLKTMSESQLQRCSGCKLLFYCCKEHQQIDWPHHKPFCKGVQVLLNKTQSVDLWKEVFKLNPGDRKKMIDALVVCIELFIKRRLTCHEYLFFSNPYICNVCHIYKDGSMITCQDCSAVAYCSDEHKENSLVDHSVLCKMLKIILEYEKNCDKGFIVLANITDNIKLSADIQTFIDKFIKFKTLPPGKEMYTAYYLSKVFTIPLTVIYVIEKSMSETKMKSGKLTIHIVGGRQFENNALLTWEYLFHYFKKLRCLNLVFIGPDTSSRYLQTPVLCCSECRSSRQINFRMESVLYHEYLGKESSEKPDVIMAFHCGFYEYKCLLKNESWNGSMQSLCSFSDTVLAFTSYKEQEAKEDLTIFKESCGNNKLDYLIESEPNPFRDLLPHYPGLYEKEVVFNNSYITVVRS